MSKSKNKPQYRSNSLFLLKITVNDQRKNRLSFDSSQTQQNKFQKTQIKSKYQSIKNPFAQITSNKNDKVTSKLVSIKKPRLSIKRLSHRKTFEITQSLTNLQLANGVIKQIIYLLQSNFIIAQRQSNNFCIKIEDLKKLLQAVLLFKTNNLQERLLKDNQEFTNCLSSLWKAVESQMKKNKTQGFNFFHKVNFQVTHEDYQYQARQKRQAIWELQSLLKQKETALSDMELSLKESYSHKQAIKLMIRDKEIFFEELCRKCQVKEHLLLHLQAETAKKQQFLRHVQDREQAILNFVNNQQKSKMAKVISEEYKQIQSDLFEYAVYLQANQLASSLTYEHLPIVCHTYRLEQELSTLCKDLLQSRGQTVEEKCLKMKKFVLQVHGRYRKQGVEIKKVMDFKTNWIIKYVNKMKMWLSNWELKQEYLKNLRVQYLLTYQNIMSILTDNRKAKKTQTGGQLEPEQRQKVIGLFFKIKENFEMGNSFY